MINRIKPRIGLVIGDPCGIGPELTAQLVARPAIQEMADIVIKRESAKVGARRAMPLY